DAVVPQARARVIGMALCLVLRADRGLEGLLLLAAPGLAGLFQAVALDLRQHAGRLFAAHHRAARVGPHPQETRRVGASAHAVVARAEAAADDPRELRHPCAGDRRHHFGAVAGYAFGLVFLADHETGD